MTELRVINGIKKEEPDYFSLYSTAFINTLIIAVKEFGDIKDFDLDARRKLVWSGVKMMIASKSRSNNRRGATDKLALIQDINDIASGLTPREFQTIFPIEKYYLGEKHGMKDYFHSKKYIEEFGEDSIIGENITTFLWNYWNWDITDYQFEAIDIEFDLRLIDNPEEEFFEEDTPMHTEHDGINGEKFIINQDGEISKIKKPTPEHLKVIK